MQHMATQLHWSCAPHTTGNSPSLGGSSLIWSPALCLHRHTARQASRWNRGLSYIDCPTLTKNWCYIADAVLDNKSLQPEGSVHMNSPRQGHHVAERQQDLEHWAPKEA